MRAEAAKRQPLAPARPTATARQRNARSWLPWLAAVLALGLWPNETGSVHTAPPSTAAHAESSSRRDAVSLGDTALNASAALAHEPARGAIAQELPKKPLPGQHKPDANGRCPNKQLTINGGCWLKVDFAPAECAGNGFTYRGGCYIPFLVSPREPTSAPQQR
jgi:hypothetical protein